MQRFDAHIKPEGGRALVIGSAIVGGAAVLAGLVLSEPLLVFLALIAFAVSLYNYPLITRDEAHLSASLQGLTIEGLGSLNWKSITSVSFEEPHGIVLNLSDKLDSVVSQAEDSSALRTLQISLWKQPDDQTLVLNLSEFEESPADIHDAVKRFHAHGTA